MRAAGIHLEPRPPYTHVGAVPVGPAARWFARSRWPPSPSLWSVGTTVMALGYVNGAGG
jgi:hypothetical protein